METRAQGPGNLSSRIIRARMMETNHGLPRSALAVRRQRQQHITNRKIARFLGGLFGWAAIFTVGYVLWLVTN